MSSLTDKVAIIGLAFRGPGANSPEELWSNLVAGEESIHTFDVETMIKRGVDPLIARRDNYRPTYGGATALDEFDASYFGMTQREAEIADPQFRLFLELTHSAIQRAGVERIASEARVGVYGGSAHNDYREDYVDRNELVRTSSGGMSVRIGTNPDYIAPLASFRLGLTGQAVSLYTACSTSLVAVHLAAQALLLDEIDIAIAGGVQVDVPLGGGYLFSQGNIYSESGHVQPFSAQADGTVFTDGGGVVVLKKLSDAQRDGDHIHGVIVASGINNDADRRAGFTSPSVDGQRELIAAILRTHNIDPASIDMVEAHGTGTVVGDPIEVRALAEAYREVNAKLSPGTCSIGSAKGNVGHLGAAAGMAGLIKACFAVSEGRIPPTINWAPLNPALSLEDTPFRIAEHLEEWPAGERRRRAAVSSFGIGGTNAHLIVEQPDERATFSDEPDEWSILPVSADTTESLKQTAEALADAIEAVKWRATDVAHSLTHGRRDRKHRLAALAQSTDDAPQALIAPVAVGEKDEPVQTAFLFPGQGAQFVDMSAELIERFPAYREAFHRVAALFLAEGIDVREAIFGTHEQPASTTDLAQTRITQPALFTVEYALSETLRDMGIKPVALHGHSIGELVAATVAGVFSLEDAVTLVAARGRLMQSTRPGAMAAVPISADELEALLPSDVEIAASNSTTNTVVSGPEEPITVFLQELEDLGMPATRLQTSHSFHSSSLDPVLSEFRSVVAGLTLSTPTIPLISNVTGTWMTDDQATSPDYWVAQVRQRVRFAEGMATLSALGPLTTIEVGPGRALTTFARHSQTESTEIDAISTLAPRSGEQEIVGFLTALAQLWCRGAAISLETVAAMNGRTVPLPPHRYQRRRHWVEPDAMRRRQAQDNSDYSDPITAPFAVPNWEQAPATDAPKTAALLGESWLIIDHSELGTDEVSDRARALGASVSQVVTGPDFLEVMGDYEVRPGEADDAEEVIRDLRDRGSFPDRIVLAIGEADGETAFERSLGAYALSAAWARAIAAQASGEETQITLVTVGARSIAGEPSTPEIATAIGPLLTLPREAQGVDARHLDADAGALADDLVHAIIGGTDEIMAIRGGRRWFMSFEPMVQHPIEAIVNSRFREGSTYLITGGMGGLGLAIAERLTERLNPTLILLGRHRVAERERWEGIAAGSGDEADRIRALLDLEAKGAIVVPVSCDVTDADAFRTTLTEVTRERGRIDGVVHAAGLPGGQLLAVHDLDRAAAVIAPKVVGAEVIVSEANGGSLADCGFIALFSSVNTATAPYGLCDYVGANSYLDALAANAQRQHVPVLSIGWGGWADVGMVSTAGAGEAFRQFTAALSGQPEKPIDHPFVRGITRTDADKATVRATLEPGCHWVIDDHRIGGVGVVPAAAVIEMLRATACELVGVESVRISDVLFLGPIEASAPTTLTITCTRIDDDSWSFDLRASSSPDEAGTIRASGRLSAAPPQPESVTIPDVDLAEVTETPGGGLVEFGPHFDIVRRYGRDGDVGVALVTGIAADPGTMWIDPAVLDRAAHGIRGELGVGYLPFGYSVVDVYHPVRNETIIVQRHHPTDDSDLVQVDEMHLNTSGEVCMVVTGYALKAMRDGVGSEDVDASPALTTAPAQGSPALAQLVPKRSFLSVVQGQELFERALSGRYGPMLYATTGRLADRIRETRSFRVEKLTGPTAVVDADSPRSHLLPEYVAPRTPVEELVTTLWSQALGIAHVGIDDDFFMRGGSSLVAVQLVGRTREQSGVVLSVADIFQNPTARRLAGLIEERLGEQVDELSDDQVDELLAGAMNDE